MLGRLRVAVRSRDFGDFVQTQDRISSSALFGYGVATMPVMYSYVLILIMYMKYAAEDLGASPAAVGTVFLAAKLWDAVTDPAVGNLSDRTRSKWGRRRPWLYSSAPLLAGFSLMLWVPPASLEGGALIAWITVAVFGFYTAYTIFEVPHMSLGAELSFDGAERNRIFATRQMLKTAALFITGVLGSMIVEEGGRDATRVMAFVVAALTLVIITSGVRLLPPERMEFQGRGGENPLKAVRDVISNRHARLLLVVMFIDAIGTGGIGVLTPFVLDYVVGRPDLLGYMLGINMGATFLGIPIWLRLGRRYEKRRLLLLAMFGSGIGYGSITLVSEGAWWVIAVSGLIAGLSSSCPNVLGYTLKSEIVDVDEYTTGERKEGAYFAGWSFVNKLAAGIMIGLVGWALEWSGFDGQADAQTEFVKTTMVVLMGGFPLVCYAIGAALFSRFSLTEAEHARIRLALDERRADATPG